METYTHALSVLHDANFRSYSEVLESIDKSEGGVIRLKGGVYQYKLDHRLRALVLIDEIGNVLGPACPIRGCSSYSGAGTMCDCLLKELDAQSLSNVESVRDQPSLRACNFGSVDAKGVMDHLAKLNDMYGPWNAARRRLFADKVKLDGGLVVGKSGVHLLDQKLSKTPVFVISTENAQYTLCTNGECLERATSVSGTLHVCNLHADSTPVDPVIDGRKVLVLCVADLFQRVYSLNSSLSDSVVWFKTLAFLFLLGQRKFSKGSVVVTLLMSNTFQLSFCYSTGNRRKSMCIFPFCLFCTSEQRGGSSGTASRTVLRGSVSLNQLFCSDHSNCYSVEQIGGIFGGLPFGRYSLSTADTDTLLGQFESRYGDHFTNIVTL